MSDPKIFVLHENDAWVEPLRAAFAARGLPYEEWFLDTGRVDLDAVPPEGVFYNRMSASSHTRNHRYAPELTGLVLSWLESHGRHVVNNGRALALEISKVKQYAALSAHGIRTPRTIAAVGLAAVIEAAESFAPGPVILKPNRGGRGQGVQLFGTVEALRAHLEINGLDESIDGVHLLQQYVRAPEPYITRAEFVGGRFLYAVRVDTRDGFELCPADACQIGESFCPTAQPATPKFTIIDTIDPGLVARYERFLAANGIGIAGIEFVTEASGIAYTYDVNTNTNYNADAEARAKRSGMGAIADFLGAELQRIAGEPKQAFRAVG